MQKIIPHLWFDKEAVEAAEFYASVFPESSVDNVNTLHNTPTGDCDVVNFNLWGLHFMAISAGPLFTFNPSVSFMVNFDPSREEDARKKLNEVWEKLAEGGKPLMPIDKYFFSERYGWIQDKYGLSWQLILTDPEGDPRPTIVPSLMFIGENRGKAESAQKFYLSIFQNAKPGSLHHYDNEQGEEMKGKVMFSDFKIKDLWITAMDSPPVHDFNFNEAISFIVTCENQKEIDYYWSKLSALPDAEQCGWLKDKYSLSWQIVPSEMDEMMRKGSQGQIDRITKAFLQMKKFDLAKLREAFNE